MTDYYQKTKTKTKKKDMIVFERILIVLGVITFYLLWLHILNSFSL